MQASLVFETHHGQMVSDVISIDISGLAISANLVSKFGAIGCLAVFNICVFQLVYFVLLFYLFPGWGSFSIRLALKP